ncbi:MAG: V-type ATP synthase subunit F [Gammaproteobacteria bacterium]|mgnify:FL=1|jgi:vacuolar-type H+-ATPase subunit F/Vma7
MSVPVFIGDELTCAGFRMAGLDVFEAAPENLEADFRHALEAAPMVIITTGVAAALPRSLVETAMRRARPPVAVVPAAVGGPPMPDVEHEVRAALGVES